MGNTFEAFAVNHAAGLASEPGQFAGEREVEDVDHGDAQAEPDLETCRLLDKVRGGAFEFLWALRKIPLFRIVQNSVCGDRL